MTTQENKSTWIIKTDRTTADGKPFYISRREGEALTTNQGWAKTWGTFAGAMRWLNGNGWKGHGEPVERLGVWV